MCVEKAFRRNQRSTRRLLFAASIVALPWLANAAQTPGADPSVEDWPCRQVLVREISLPAVWSGPSIDGIAWRKDRAVADLVARLAARRTSMEDAERAIDEFAASSGRDKTSRLTTLFAGLFETFNAERTQVIDGLIRFGGKLKNLAAKIRSAQASRGTDEVHGPVGAEPAGVDRSLEWDLRIFEEQRQSIGYACETPALIEQRVFALARAIERNLD